MISSAGPLDDDQVMARYLTLVVRNNLEDLHAGHGPIADALMKQINQRVRNALYTGLHAVRWMDRSISASRWVEYHLRSIPSYWEAPALIPAYRDGLEPDMDSARPLPAESSPEYQIALEQVRPMVERISARFEGRSIRGAKGEALRKRLERVGVSHYLALSSTKRLDPSCMSYLEADLTERTQEMGGRQAS